MIRPCKCGECAFFTNEDVNGYGHCTITRNHNRCDDLCKFKEDHMSAVKRSNISEIFWDENGDHFYKAKINLISLDENTGAERKKAIYILVQASDLNQAAKNLAEGMSGWGFVETRRPCKGYPRRPFWRRIRSNPMRRNYH